MVYLARVPPPFLLPRHPSLFPVWRGPWPEPPPYIWVTLPRNSGLFPVRVYLPRSRNAVPADPVFLGSVSCRICFAPPCLRVAR